MRQYETFELRFAGPVLTENWADIDLQADFTCEGRTVTVPGFYDGDGVWTVRFLPDRPGRWQWRTRGELSFSGEEDCAPAAGSHGLVKAAGTHFEYQDGALFRPFGTTVYALAHQEDALVEETLNSLSQAPFNKVRLCVFPKHYDYNHNEPPFYPFERSADGSWDTGRPCIAFWQRFEHILDRIAALGIQVDLILFHPYDRWGFASMSREDNLRYLDGLLRRLAAKPALWWSLANEYDLNLDHKSLADWEEIESFTASHDPYGHLLSCHNCFRFWDFSRPNITHASIQTKALTEIPRWLKIWGKPVMVDECCYEGNLPHFWGSISGREMVKRFWRCAASGGSCTHGETFLSEDEVLWWARGGRLKGESPRRIAFLREVLESLPGPLEPAAESFQALGSLTEEELDALASEGEGGIRPFALSLRMMEPRERALHLAAEHTWQACCGEEAFLWYNDLQCHGEQTLRLPADKRYRVELIDPWEMTRALLCEDVSGETKIALPGRENLAVLATRMGE
ncbi:MAG: DUF5060 domain-containing protein [Clostridia bacterium]|nr:DUF5060 domain-containing protein [Clostridia bacterium]